MPLRKCWSGKKNPYDQPNFYDCSVFCSDRECSCFEERNAEPPPPGSIPVTKAELAADMNKRFGAGVGDEYWASH